MPRLGILALQGDVREHQATVQSLGVDPLLVRTPQQLEDVDALILPGGESTAIAHLLGTSGLRESLAARLSDGMAAFGTCAGLIALSTEVLDGRSDQWSFAILDVSVRRNGYGRQVASFETAIDVKGIGLVPGVFIRAPRIERWGAQVELLATHNHGDGSHPVLIRQGAVWGCSFHPELTTNSEIHALFLNQAGF
jgi:5'-phosphate synthase pdxT subunit